ncbi:hypothetical protein EON65_33685, partial [archaeon]
MPSLYTIHHTPSPQDFDSATEDLQDLYELIDASMDYIFTLTFRQLPSHIELFELSSLLPNLSKLDVVYGVKKVGWCICMCMWLGLGRCNVWYVFVYVCVFVYGMQFVLSTSTFHHSIT